MRIKIAWLESHSNKCYNAGLSVLQLIVKNYKHKP